MLHIMPNTDKKFIYNTKNEFFIGAFNFYLDFEEVSSKYHWFGNGIMFYYDDLNLRYIKYVIPTNLGSYGKLSVEYLGFDIKPLDLENEFPVSKGWSFYDIPVVFYPCDIIIFNGEIVNVSRFFLYHCYTLLSFTNELKINPEVYNQCYNKLLTKLKNGGKNEP